MIVCLEFLLFDSFVSIHAEPLQAVRVTSSSSRGSESLFNLKSYDVYWQLLGQMNKICIAVTHRMIASLGDNLGSKWH